MEVIGQEDVSAAEAKKILSEVKNRKEPVYEQKISIDYFEKVIKLSDAQIKSITEELSKIAILKPRYISLILNILPTTPQEVEMVFSKERTNLKKNEIEEIAKIIQKELK